MVMQYIIWRNSIKIFSNHYFYNFLINIISKYVFKRQMEEKVIDLDSFSWLLIKYGFNILIVHDICKFV